jgi:hypothetical protein
MYTCSPILFYFTCVIVVNEVSKANVNTIFLYSGIDPSKCIPCFGLFVSSSPCRSSCVIDYNVVEVAMMETSTNKMLISGVIEITFISKSTLYSRYTGISKFK